MPLYENGELVGAIEMVQDLTDERKRQEATEALVDEVSGTLRALTAGDAGAGFAVVADEVKKSSQRNARTHRTDH